VVHVLAIVTVRSALHRMAGAVRSRSVENDVFALRNRGAGRCDRPPGKKTVLTRSRTPRSRLLDSAAARASCTRCVHLVKHAHRLAPRERPQVMMGPFSHDVWRARRFVTTGVRFALTANKRCWSEQQLPHFPALRGDHDPKGVWPSYPTSEQSTFVDCEGALVGRRP